MGSGVVGTKVLALGVFFSVLPDADILLMRLGVPYDSALGHRGISHSLLFASMTATTAAFGVRNEPGLNFRWIWLYFMLCAISHPLLDTCTNAGHGVALLWPLSEARFFAPFRPIEASPLSMRRFFGEPGLRVLVSEFIWVWVPCLSLAFMQYWRKRSGV
jgi:inner membrane protein